MNIDPSIGLFLCITGAYMFTGLVRKPMKTSGSAGTIQASLLAIVSVASFVAGFLIIVLHIIAQYREAFGG